MEIISFFPPDLCTDMGKTQRTSCWRDHRSPGCLGLGGWGAGVITFLFLRSPGLFYFCSYFYVTLARCLIILHATRHATLARCRIILHATRHATLARCLVILHATRHATLLWGGESVSFSFAGAIRCNRPAQHSS